MPQAVIDAWKAVWTFFQDNPQIQRKYTTDFEAYHEADKVAVHIGIK